jgi:hypothetical protein
LAELYPATVLNLSVARGFIVGQANYMHRLTAFYATNELVAAAVTNRDADGTNVGLTMEVCRFNIQFGNALQDNSRVCSQ